MADSRYYLGLDLGSVSLDLMVMDAAETVLWHAYRQVQGRARDAVAALCRDLLAEWMRPGEVNAFAGAMATGSGKEIVRELLDIAVVNEIVAHGFAAAGLARGRASVIEIGGQDSKYILVDEKGACDYAMNELCAAGTGAFLDVQAERLGLDIRELAAMAATAAIVPPMAGRCSVFAKSDIIHLQQRGVPLEQIVAGLCYALARNYVATLIRGREIVKPVIFQGGVALNDGVLRAFKEILHLADAEILRPDMPHLAGARGAALLAMKSETGGLETAAIARVAALPSTQNGRGKIVRGWREEHTATRQLQELETFEVLETIQAGHQVFIGLDIGSISTKAVLLSPQGVLLAKVYLLTAGVPLQSARKALGFLAGIISAADVAAVGVTGSGRKLVGHALGADLVVDEITAQAKGAWHGSAQADTVIEIGGQDAKFIRIGEDGGVTDFEMNKVCAAGTGSFIQEQAVRLGVDLKDEYSALALSSSAPLPFTSRCTVFMGSDLVHHVQQGVALPDLLMGVSQAVVENYLHRVVQGRRLGGQVVLQGGVAKNLAVVQAFKAKLHRLNSLQETPLTVHPHPGESGALGIALLTLEHFQRQSANRPVLHSSFKGLDFSTTYQASSFTCTICENRCEVSVFTFSNNRFHFGDLCGRYSEASSSAEPGQDLTPEMLELVGRETDSVNPIATVGLPATLLFREFYPFWRTFFAELAIRLVVSGPSNNTKLTLALSRLPVETCLPLKLLFGHVASLQQEGQERIFIPSRSRLLDGLSCPYIQHAAAMVSSSFPGIDIITLPLLPDLPRQEKERLTLKAAELFGVDREKAARAYERASEEFHFFRQRTEYDARSPGLRQRPLAVLLGKPYNVDDRFINMSLAAKLARAGFDVISATQLRVPEDLPLPEPYDSVTWALSRRMLKIGIYLNTLPDIYPVVVGNFGCGPDSFTFPLLQELFAQRPSLFLEFDEHRADAGLATRIEAFSHRIMAWRAQTSGGKNLAGRRQADPLRHKTVAPAASSGSESSEYIIPYFSDHAHAFAGALGARGLKARVLPLPDHNSYETGVELSGGKQCHPFQLIAGDLVNLARAGNLPQNACYILPTVETGCLITQYVPTIQMYMKKICRSDVKVLSANSLEVLNRFGPMCMFDLGKAILGIEYLGRLKFAKRPYELEKGTVDQAYQAGLSTIYQRQLADKTNQGIMEAALALAAVPTGARGSKPVIAITGDAYTRINQTANGDLFALLEELGCEVWPSPTLVDVIMCGQEIRVRQQWEAGNPLEMVLSWGRVLVNNLGASFVNKNFEGLLSHLTEPHADKILQYTKELLPGEPELLISLNVAKHVDFANKGVDGILNVYCLNCLVGTATTSIFKRLAEMTNGVPIMPLIFDDMGGTHVRNRVEAFVHRVKRNREEKLAAGRSAGNGADHLADTDHLGHIKELLDRILLDMSMPKMKFPEIKLPQMKIPVLQLPESLRSWAQKKQRRKE